MANEAYIQVGTALSINGEAGADYAWSVEGLATASGRVSAQIDLGAAPRPYLYHWTCEVIWQATPTQILLCELLKAGAPDSDSTAIDGDVGASDAAIPSVYCKVNMQYIGSVISELGSAGDVNRSSGYFVHYYRYLTLGIINNAGASINATDSNFQFILTPVYYQGQ